MLSRALALAAALTLTLAASPLVQPVAALGCQPAELPAITGTSTCTVTCGASAIVSASAEGYGTVGVSCGGKSCTDSGLNPSCSILTTTSGSGTCSWAGIGNAHCNT